MQPGIQRGLPRWCRGSESTWQCRRRKRCRFDAWVAEVPWRRKWQPTPAFLPEEFHGQRGLMGYSPCDCNKSGTTERMHLGSREYAWVVVKRGKELSSNQQAVGNAFLSSTHSSPYRFHFIKLRSCKYRRIVILSFQITSPERTF